MQILDGAEAYQNLRAGMRRTTHRLPKKSEPGYAHGMLAPALSPRFALTPGEKVFTIGSCFAREIEKRLAPHGFDLPVHRFPVPPEEFGHGVDLINEYNAGTILQRIESAYGLFTYTDEMGIEGRKGFFNDMFLHFAQTGLPLDRVLERRGRIAELYRHLLDAPVAVITLGLTETWFDNEHRCYLNKAPARSSVLDHPGRFAFHRMDVDDVLQRMTRAIDIMNQHGPKRIILTVSPIPLEATFWNANAIVANSYSKSVLRVVAQVLFDRFANLDYFPSYEMALSAGLPQFHDDNIHLDGEAVDAIIRHMMANYLPGAPPAADSKAAESVDHYVDIELADRLVSRP